MVQVSLIQLLKDGAVDPSFGGGDGVVATSRLARCGLNATGMAVDSTGRVLVTGTTDCFAVQGRSDAGFVARFKRDGSPDRSFGRGGVRSQRVAQWTEPSATLMEAPCFFGRTTTASEP